MNSEINLIFRRSVKDHLRRLFCRRALIKDVQFAIHSHEDSVSGSQ